MRSAVVLAPLALVVMPVLGSTATWWTPAANASFLYSINEETIPTKPKSSARLDESRAAIYDVDLFTTSAASIKTYKAQGKKVVCYFSAGSWEDDRPDKAAFDPACYCNQGDSCKMDGWDEWWFDIHSTKCIKNLKTVHGARIALAKCKGCDAVDPDNVDSYTNENGFGNTQADQLNFNIWLASTAHASGLAVGLKNSGDLLSAYTTNIVKAYDFVVVEQCEQYQECDVYTPFVRAGKPAFDIEYSKKAVCKPGWFTMQYKSLGLSYKNVVATCPKY